jgi:hypothetical protein
VQPLLQTMLVLSFRSHLLAKTRTRLTMLCNPKI